MALMAYLHYRKQIRIPNPTIRYSNDWGSVSGWESDFHSVQWEQFCTVQYS